MNDTNTDELLNELAIHMCEAGELTETGDVCMEDGAFEDGYVLQQKAKLVLLAGADAAYIVPSGQDWAHDALGDSIVIPGTIYSDDQPFLEGDASAVRGRAGEPLSSGWNLFNSQDSRIASQAGISAGRQRAEPPPLDYTHAATGSPDLGVNLPKTVG